MHCVRSRPLGGHVRLYETFFSQFLPLRRNSIASRYKLPIQPPPPSLSARLPFPLPLIPALLCVYSVRIIWRLGDPTSLRGTAVRVHLACSCAVAVSSTILTHASTHVQFVTGTRLALCRVQHNAWWRHEGFLFHLHRLCAGRRTGCISRWQTLRAKYCASLLLLDRVRLETQHGRQP